MMTVEEFVQKNGNDFIAEFLAPWIATQSISSDRDGKKAEMVQAAEQLIDELQQSGFTTRRYKVENGNDAVYAERIIDPELPTVLVYGHYDVQPIKQEEEWRTNPFELIIDQDGEAFARGIADDKGQLAAHFLALRYFSAHGDLPCNVKFIVEGNEEDGSGVFSKFAEQNAELLACDLVVVSDTNSLREGYPALTVGLKGMVGGVLEADTPQGLLKIISETHDPIKNRCLIPGFYDAVVDYAIPKDVVERFGQPTEEMGRFLRPEEGFEPLEHQGGRPTNDPLHLGYINESPVMEGKTYKITVHGPNASIHSGSYGGPVQNPATHLAHLLTGLSKKWTLEIDYLEYSAFQRATAILPTACTQVTVIPGMDLQGQINKVLDKYNLSHEMVSIEEVDKRLEYLDSESELNTELLNCIRDPEHEENQNPEFYAGPRARLSYRMVGNQDPHIIAKSVEDFASEREGRFTLDDASEAVFSSTEDEFVQATKRGMQEGYGIDTPVDEVYEGGSIPTMRTLAKVTGRPISFMGFCGENARIHGPNEHLNVDSYIFKGAKSVVYALQEIGKLEKRAA